MQNNKRVFKKRPITCTLLLFVFIVSVATMNTALAADEPNDKPQPEKRQKYSKFFDKKAHWCDALVITCNDFRFTTATQEFINDRLGLKGNYDYISIPGSIRNLMDSKTRDLVLNEFGVSVRLHRVNRVIIFAHQDCTGYGGAKNFSETAEEFATIAKDLRKARRLMGIKFPHLKVYLYYETIFYDDHKRIYNFKQIL
ncbi:MAG: hypothetical protein HUU08_02040 [Candidatus Brocadia sp.]|nr:hypothetical protein [Candidatus Brocadia sp.]